MISTCRRGGGPVLGNPTSLPARRRVVFVPDQQRVNLPGVGRFDPRGVNDPRMVRVDRNVVRFLAKSLGLRRNLSLLAQRVKARTQSPRMAHGIADKIIDLLSEKQTQLRAAAQRFFGEENVGPARAAADREVAGADFPLLELLGDFRANSFCLAGGKTWRLPIGLVDHVPAANHDLVESAQSDGAVPPVFAEAAPRPARRLRVGSRGVEKAALARTSSGC